MNIKSATLVASFLAIGVLASCAEQEAPETVSTVASDPAPAAAVPQGPARIPPVTLEMDYLAPEAYAFGADAAAAGRCALDAINGSRVAEGSVASGSDVLFGGWAGDADNQAASSALFVLRGDASYAIPLTTGGERADVARATGSEALAASGFNLPVRLAGVAPGRYSLVVVLDPSTSAFCDLEKSLIVE